MLDLRSQTPPEWLALVLANFDEFLLDHALCERKASAMGMSLVAKYPARTLIVDDLIAFAREELEHFHVMWKVVDARGLVLRDDKRDEYVNALIGLSKGRRDEDLFVDRMLVPAIVEARSCERLCLVSEALEPGPLKDTYLELTRAEARHHALFFRLARRYVDEAVVRARASELLDHEERIVASLPLRPAVH